MDTNFKDIHGKSVMSTDTVRFTDEVGRVVESGIHMTWLGLSVKRELGLYSSLGVIVDVFGVEIINITNA